MSVNTRRLGARRLDPSHPVARLRRLSLRERLDISQIFQPAGGSLVFEQLIEANESDGGSVVDDFDGKRQARVQSLIGGHFLSPRPSPWRGEGQGEGFFCFGSPLTLTLSPQSRGEGTRKAPVSL